MPSKFAIRLLSSGIAGVIFALIASLRVLWIGNNIALGELVLWLTLCTLAILDASVQFAKLWKQGLGFTPINEIIHTSKKDQR